MSADTPALDGFVGVDHIEYATGAAAHARMSDPAFRATWQALWESCPWSTGFQGPAFATAWWSAYGDVAEPHLLWAVGPSGALQGILALALLDGGTRLTCVGAHQAEYHAWLARPDDGDAFIAAALQRLARERHAMPHTPNALRFFFLPPGTPTAWAMQAAPGRAGAHVVAHRRGLMAVDDGEADRSLKKSGNRSKMNRLQRVGAVRFERITAPDMLAALLDQIAAHTDIRQGAIHDATPFTSDPRKAAFHVAMLREPGLLHAAVLRVGDAIAAAHLGVITRRQVALGLISHSPFLAAHSPGKLLLLLLAEMLGREEFTELDLTPGGEYKDRFATRYDVAHELTVYFTTTAWLRARMRRQTRRAAKALALRVVADRERVQALVDRVGSASVLLRHPRHLAGRVSQRLRAAVRSQGESRFYRMSAAEAAALPEPTVVLQRDRLADLLQYVPVGPNDRSQAAFFRDALARLERGEHVYTLAEHGTLVHYSWTIPRQTQSASEWGQPYPLPDGTSVLFDDYTHPSARGRGLHSASLRQRARDAAADGAAWVYISVLADNAASRRNIERVGFEHCASFFREMRLGRTRLW